MRKDKTVDKLHEINEVYGKRSATPNWQKSNGARRPIERIERDATRLDFVLVSELKKETDHDV